MDMHHGFKRFEDYTPWMGMYFTIAGDVYYFKFAGHSHAETCFESGCQLNLPRIISVCSCPALTTELEYIYSKSCSAIEPAENLTEAPSRAPESGRYCVWLKSDEAPSSKTIRLEAEVLATHHVADDGPEAQ